MGFFRVSGIGKSFGGLTALHNVSFELHEKEIVGLIGPNGAGKTTLFNLIAGTFSCDSGRIEFKGQTIHGLKPHEICRRGIARTFQIVRPFAEMTCPENVIVAFIGNTCHAGDRAGRQKAAEALLDLVGLGHAVHEKAQHLNLISKKRLEIARALATQPQLILLDEVLGGLNSGEMAEALGLIRTIRDERSISILWIEHVMGALMKLVERVLVLDNGQLICEGTPEEVVANPQVIEAYLGEVND